MAVPPTGKQAPGYYRYMVGSYEVTVVTDGINARPLPENFILNATALKSLVGLRAEPRAW
jgi:hypothetical protein